MGPIQEDYDKKKSDYDAVANGRYKLYPDNPRLKEEFDRVHTAFEDIKSRHDKLETEIDQMKSGISVWKEELKELRKGLTQ